MKNKTIITISAMILVIGIMAGFSMIIVETNEPQEEKQYIQYEKVIKTEDIFGIPIKQTPFGYLEKTLETIIKNMEDIE